MRRRSCHLILLTLGAVISQAWPAIASEAFCAHCGSAESCRKVCRLVREDRKVEVTCWGCRSEEFCVPGPSEPSGKHCELVCDEDADATSPCVKPKKFIWTEWIPDCNAKIYTKQKLMKRTITKTIPSHKWMVEPLCGQCAAAVSSGTPRR